VSHRCWGSRDTVPWYWEKVAAGRRCELLPREQWGTGRGGEAVEWAWREESVGRGALRAQQLLGNRAITLLSTQLLVATHFPL